MIDFSSPLSGMTQAETSVNQIAAHLAQPPSDSIDLSAELVSMMAARNNFASNATALQTEDQMAQSALSIFA
jgi:hypothetical protein